MEHWEAQRMLHPEQYAAPAPRVTEGDSYAKTAHLAVKDLVPLLRVLAAAKLAELKSRGAAPRSARVFVAYDGPAYCASLIVRITARSAFAHSDAVVREIEALRESFNRETLHTPADSCRYYGATALEIGA